MITAERLDSWRIVPRALILSYMVVFYQTCNWFMSLPDPNNAQAGFVSVVVGAGAMTWFGLYVNGNRASVQVSSKTEKGRAMITKLRKYFKRLWCALWNKKCHDDCDCV